MTECYNKHYVTIDAQGRVADGWSDGPHPERDTTDAICINAEGGYQFRLFPGGEENPPLHTMDGIPLYMWDGGQAVPRSEDEITADRAAIPPSPHTPTAEERLDALENAMIVMMGGGLSDV